MIDKLDIDDLPDRCHGCAKAKAPAIHKQCGFCKDLGFQEAILCQLNRSIQDKDSFRCYAFQPILQVIGKKTPKSPQELVERPAETEYRKLFDKDKIKYQKALALQKLAKDPEEEIINLKFHFAWNACARKPFFSTSGAMVKSISSVIAKCSTHIGGFSYLLWLAADHMHIYVESDGEISPEEMAKILKQSTEKEIFMQFPVGNSDASLWDGAYFVETVG